MKAVLYARVSSREQEREGYSIPAQRKLLKAYAATAGLTIGQEFIDVESAKNPGRKEFSKMLRVLRENGDIRVVLVEKTDRLYRNRTDSLAFEELIEKSNLELHLVKENRVISKDCRSQDKFMHDIHVALSKHYIENLREEVKKGMREKAEQGIYPGRAPLGYRNNPATRNIEVLPEKAAVVRRVFDLYATGQYSLITLRKTVRDETGISIARAYLETVLKNPFYVGDFVWRDVRYKGTHPPIVDLSTFQGVQDVFAGRNKPKYRKHDFPFRGLLTCAHDGCTVTTERHKGKYDYYRCSGGRGKCVLPYMPEAKVASMLREPLKGIQVPESIAQDIVSSITSDEVSSQHARRMEAESAKQRLAQLRSRIDRLYEDKLDGKITQEFWAAKTSQYREQELALETALKQLRQPTNTDRALTVQRVFELANRAYSLYITRNVAEQSQLLKMVLLNCATDGVSLWPNYRKPFDIIARRAKNEEWSGRADLNCRPLAPQASALPG
jgi:site-specific DNA recombinase